MSFDIREREREGIVLLDCKGRLVVGESTAALRESLSRLQSAQKFRVVLNLAGVDYIDSTGLGSLVVVFTSLKKAGGAMKLLNLNDRNLELLVLTKLTTVFEIFTNEVDAVNSFFPNRKIQKFDILSFLESQKQRKEEK